MRFTSYTTFSNVISALASMTPPLILHLRSFPERMVQETEGKVSFSCNSTSSPRMISPLPASSRALTASFHVPYLLPFTSKASVPTAFTKVKSFLAVGDQFFSPTFAAARIYSVPPLGFSTVNVRGFS